MSYHETLRAHRRLEILKLLNATPGYTAGQHILAAAMPKTGVPATADQVTVELAWLAEQGLVSLTTGGGLSTAQITQRGIEAANGLAIIPGVARPSPE
ncbi:MAG: hypothetical protein OEV94_11860 [Deltaproteobacteria bacterium]|nr:hypothetical protein [Deltaproteobacteria bacterium]